MYSTIVVGTDGSETAELAVERATILAALCGASVHLVHGYGSQAIADPMGGVALVTPEDHVQALRSKLDARAGELRASGVDATAHVMPKSGAEALISCAEQEDADLIVVGNRGMSSARRFILGSVPNAVSHHAPCSVLIVHTE